MKIIIIGPDSGEVRALVRTLERRPNRVETAEVRDVASIVTEIHHAREAGLIIVFDGSDSTDPVDLTALKVIRADVLLDVRETPVIVYAKRTDKTFQALVDGYRAAYVSQGAGIAELEAVIAGFS
jgi:hypothetical protein